MRRQIEAAALGPPEKATSLADFLKSPQVWRRRYGLSEDFVGFQGHFEGHPVLPALAQVFAAQDLVQALSPGPVTLEAITQAKFLSLVRPGHLLSAYASIPGDGGEWRVHLTSAAEGQPEVAAAFLRLKFKEGGHGL